MKTLRRILLAILIVCVFALAWLWWNRPQKVDMAAYVPASSLVYLESNSLTDIGDTITSGESWKLVRPFIPIKHDWPGRQTRRLVSFTGLGPTASVILTRAQIAIVMLDLGAREQGDTITIKPEAALLIETHTSASRMRSTVEEALGELAERSYKQPTFRRVQAEGDEFLIWTSADKSRQIVATIDDSLVIVANSERAVKACLEARRGLRPTMVNDPDLQQMRTTLAANNSLAFGFVSSAHTGELLELGAPLLFGRPPGDTQVEGLFARNAPKILGAIGWSARGVGGEINDQYFFNLRGPVAARLRPVFQTAAATPVGSKFIPNAAHSVTLYRFEAPAETWRTLQTTLSSQLDTLSAVLLNSVLRSALLPYGVAEPDKFLQLVEPGILTARLKPDASGSILIAKVKDEKTLRDLLQNAPENEPGAEERKMTFQFQDGYVLLGSEEDVQQCLKVGSSSIEKFTLLNSLNAESTASVLTYTRDDQRVRSFVAALSRANGSNVANDAQGLKSVIERLPSAETTTSLTELGLDRRTRSPFGQFSALVPLLFPAE